VGVAPNLKPVTDFLVALPPTGAGGFEGLVTRLCEAATGQRFRLSGPGPQAGQDARVEPGPANTIKVECKRYGRDTALDLRELTSELTQAATADPDLDLWILATSRAVVDQIARTLEDLANGAGVEVLFLDVGTDNLPRLPVLMAAYDSELTGWISTQGLSQPRKLMPALAALAKQASFSGTRSQIVSKLAGTMLGYENARRRCKAALLGALGDEGKTRAQFGQRLDIRAPGRRVISRLAIKAQLDGFLSGQSNRVVVLGEEGSGKTWAVTDWVAGAIERDNFPLTLVFSAAVEHISGSDALDTLVPRLLAKWTGIGSEAFWVAKLKRWAGAPAERGPRFLVVCDGLNERAPNWPLFFRALEEPRWAALVSAILTDRPEHWRSLRSGMFGYDEILVSGYDDSELHQALEGRHVRFEEVPPPDLHPLIRKPRYCDLVCEHFDEMKREHDFTVGRLIWMDVKYRRQNKLGFPMSEDEFVAVILEIARRHRANPVFDLGSVQSCLPCPDPEGQIYREILDGLLERSIGTAPVFHAKETHLVFGLGMLIAEEVRDAASHAPDTAEIIDQIERWFEPPAN
jgi:hypothetical protein